MNLSTHEPEQALSAYDVASYQGIAVDGYRANPVPSHWQQTGIYVLPLASPSRGKTIRRRDGVEELSSRPNVYMPIWNAPNRGRMVVNTGGRVQNPLNSYQAGQVDVNAFLANSDLSALEASQFIGGKSPRFSTAAGD